MENTEKKLNLLENKKKVKKVLNKSEVVEVKKSEEEQMPTQQETSEDFEVLSDKEKKDNFVEKISADEDRIITAKTLNHTRENLIKAKTIGDKQKILEAQEKYNVAYQEFIRERLEKENFQEDAEKRANFVEKTLAYEDRVITKKLAEFKGEQGEQNRNIFRKFIDWSNKGSLLDLFSKGKEWREKLEHIKSAESESGWLKKTAASIAFGMTKYRTGISMLLAGGAAITAFTGAGAPVSLGLLAARRAIMGVGTGYGTYDGLEGAAVAMGAKKMRAGVDDFNLGKFSEAKLKWKLNKAEKKEDNDKEINELKKEIELRQTLKEKTKAQKQVKKDGAAENIESANKELKNIQEKYTEFKKEQLKNECADLDNEELVKKLEYYEGQARRQEKKIDELPGYESYKIIQAEFRSRLKKQYMKLEKKENEANLNFEAIMDFFSKQRNNAENQIEQHIQSQKNKARARKITGLTTGALAAVGLPQVIGRGFFGAIKEGTVGLKDFFVQGIGKGEADIADLVRGFSGFKEGVSKGWEKIMSQNTKMLRVFLDEEKISELMGDLTGGVSGDYEITPENINIAEQDFNKLLVNLNYSPDVQQAVQDSFDGLGNEQKLALLSHISEGKSLEDLLGPGIKVEEVPIKLERVVDSAVNEVVLSPEVVTEPSGIKVGTLSENVKVGDQIKQIYDGQFAEATIPKNKGVIYGLYQQLSKHPEKFGYNPETDGKLESWASKIANREGMKNYGDIWVKKPGEVAYVLKGDIKSGFQIHEVDPSNGKIIGGTGMDAHEMAPIRRPKINLGPEVKPIIEPQHKFPFIKELDMNENVVDFQNQYESALTNADRGRILDKFEEYLEKSGKMENLNQVSNTKMLEELAKSKNESISYIASDTKETLLSQGSPTERVNNFLQLDHITTKDLRIVQDTFEQFGKEKMQNLKMFKPEQARLFAKYVTQSPEILRNSTGTGDHLNNAFYGFTARASAPSLPNMGIWEPRMEKIPLASGGAVERIFNVKPQSHFLRQTDYLIDFGDGNTPKVVSKNMLENVLKGQDSFHSFLGEGEKLASQAEDLAGISVPAGAKSGDDLAKLVEKLAKQPRPSAGSGVAGSAIEGNSVKINMFDNLSDQIHNKKITNEAQFLDYLKQNGEDPKKWQGKWDEMFGNSRDKSGVFDTGQNQTPVAPEPIEQSTNFNNTTPSESVENVGEGTLERTNIAFGKFIDPNNSFENRIDSLKDIIPKGRTTVWNNLSIFRSLDGNDFYYVTDIEKGTGIMLTPESINKVLKIKDIIHPFEDLDKGVDALEAINDNSVPFDKKINALRQAIKDKEILKIRGNTFYRKGEDIFLVKGNKMRKLTPGMFK